MKDYVKQLLDGGVHLCIETDDSTFKPWMGQCVIQPVSHRSRYERFNFNKNFDKYNGSEECNILRHTG